MVPRRVVYYIIYQVARAWILELIVLVGECSFRFRFIQIIRTSDRASAPKLTCHASSSYSEISRHNHGLLNRFLRRRRRRLERAVQKEFRFLFLFC